VPRRRPQVLAHQVATLDVLSGGRAIFGAGLGGNTSEFDAFGEEADARVRAELLDEGLEVLRRLWSGERVEHRGAHFTVDGVTLAPLPLRQPLPIWVGGNSRRALARAARFEGYFADSSDPEHMTITPGELADRVATIGGADDFDVVVHGYSDRADPSAYAAAGATWWLEDLHDLRAGFDELLAVVRSGVPRG
jgi:alkanesulfonate monooxygenase SsuD/methylene tetrahydromethanopterin reductase-like flavin-dependent oxidoreductase (luciferase family)